MILEPDVYIYEYTDKYVLKQWVNYSQVEILNMGNSNFFIKKPT